MNILDFFKKIINFISPFHAYKISGNSMLPTLHAGDLVVTSRLTYFFNSPKKGDMVAVRDPRDSKVLIKRITKIEEEKYFVEGDNKNHSTDSRKFGPISKSQIIGKVVYWNKYI